VFSYFSSFFGGVDFSSFLGGVYLSTLIGGVDSSFVGIDPKFEILGGVYITFPLGFFFRIRYYFNFILSLFNRFIFLHFRIKCFFNYLLW